MSRPKSEEKRSVSAKDAELTARKSESSIHDESESMKSGTELSARQPGKEKHDCVDDELTTQKSKGASNEVVDNEIRSQQSKSVKHDHSYEEQNCAIPLHD